MLWTGTLHMWLSAKIDYGQATLKERNSGRIFKTLIRDDFGQADEFGVPGQENTGMKLEEARLATHLHAELVKGGGTAAADRVRGAGIQRRQSRHAPGRRESAAATAGRRQLRDAGRGGSADAVPAAACPVPRQVGVRAAGAAAVSHSEAAAERAVICNNGSNLSARC